MRAVELGVEIVLKMEEIHRSTRSFWQIFEKAQIFPKICHFSARGANFGPNPGVGCGDWGGRGWGKVVYSVVIAHFVAYYARYKMRSQAPSLADWMWKKSKWRFGLEVWAG